MHEVRCPKLDPVLQRKHYEGGVEWKDYFMCLIQDTPVDLCQYNDCFICHIVTVLTHVWFAIPYNNLFSLQNCILASHPLCCVCALITLARG